MSNTKDELITQNKIALMKAISQEIDKRKLRQNDVAELLNIKQPRVSDLKNEKSDKFSLDILVHYMAVLGTQIEFNYDQKVKDGIKTSVRKRSS